MATVALFPSATLVLVEHLRDVLDATVVTKVTNPRPSPLVLVRRVGGASLNLVASDPLFAIECWAADPLAAEDLAELASAHIRALRGTSLDGVAIYRVAEASGPQSLPDPLSDEPRYTFTVSVAMRGTAFDASGS